MRKQISVVLLIVVVLVPGVLALPSPSRAQTPKSDLTIVKIKVPELDLFDDKGNKVGVLETSTLTLPLPVRERASNGRLKIPLADGRQVWIDGTYVTYQPSKDVAPCDPGRGIVAGATRGSGARCK